MHSNSSEFVPSWRRVYSSCTQLSIFEFQLSISLFLYLIGQIWFWAFLTIVLFLVEVAILVCLVEFEMYRSLEG
ncbi:hypothetical protein RchiOBHm_Chr1g0360591 [Rosa chinensis]|uniref:Uncharacterized protein n=1 Tax=Rosa chinensis TaxID=74649 RepID=A0A2P6SIS5_ROSCH|nr:hypothetical protein RchiOBHm_Chr1g0360591 [Rosa chinensis]